VIAAPFTGRIGDVNVEVGDQVVANQTVLLTLDTSELRAALARAIAQKMAADKTSVLALREGEKARSQIARHEAEQAQAQITLLDDQINKAEIRSRIGGRVVEGDLKGRQGATVERGDVLMRVAPVDAMRAELLVPEKRIGDVLAAVEASNQQRLDAGIPDDDPSRRDGELAAVAFPGQYLPFIVERVSPVAEVVDQRNVFRVRVLFQLHQLDEKPEGLSPGLQGVAKVQIGKASYAWLWTRDLVDWVRMKLWL
jgi:multidrug efflux pump subunit AcrA (membrane-fusion protein)